MSLIWGYGLKSSNPTIRVYDTKSEEYLQIKETKEALQIEINFAKSVKEGGIVLDYGCGPGQSAGYFARWGLVSHAFDASDAMVKLARRQSKVKVWKSTFSAFSASRTYDGIWASFSLLHAHRSEMPGLLGSIQKALVPGGKFCIGLKLGKGEATDSLGRFYTFYEESELRLLLKNAGLNWQSHKCGESKGLDGTNAKWISVFANA